MLSFLANDDCDTIAPVVYWFEITKNRAISDQGSVLFQKIYLEG